MSDISLEPYIFFKGNCREAMEFYKSVFGGELTTQMADDVPADTQNYKEEDKLRAEAMKGMVMHSSLEGGAVKLMASDSPKASPAAKKISLSLGGYDEAKMRKIFDDLSAGGKVFMPLAKQFWGDTFGSLTDKYGVEWMMNIGAEKK